MLIGKSEEAIRARTSMLKFAVKIRKKEPELSDKVSRYAMRLALQAAKE